MVVGPLHARVLADAGMSRLAVRETLAERAVRSLADMKRAGWARGAVEPGDEDIPCRAVASADDIILTVAGGHLYGYSAVVPPWVGGHESKPVTRQPGDAALDACRIGLERGRPLPQRKA